MPFTLSHPVAILAFPRNRYFHFPALVLGSMSPDFIYFLSGKPTSGGHTLFASEWLNLPLCLLFYAIYQGLLRKPLLAFMPSAWASDVPQPTAKNPLLWLLIFTYSAWIGMASHIALDAFTHKTGYFVAQFPLLQQVYFLPIFKWLQYAGGVFGLLAIVIYQHKMAQRFPYRSAKTARQKCNFWLGNGILTAILFALWQGLQPLPLAHYATHIIRFIDLFVISLLCHSLVFWWAETHNDKKFKE